MKRDEDRSAQLVQSATEYCRKLNFFCHKLAPDLYCALAEDCPVPSFLEAENWRFVADAGETACVIMEIHGAASASMRRTGYYLFRSRVAMDPAHERSADMALVANQIPQLSPDSRAAEADILIDCFA